MVVRFIMIRGEIYYYNEFIIYLFFSVLGMLIFEY